MIITEKQLLIMFDWLCVIKSTSPYSIISEEAKERICTLIAEINNQQSDKLVEIKGE